METWTNSVTFNETTQDGSEDGQSESVSISISERSITNDFDDISFKGSTSSKSRCSSTSTSAEHLPSINSEIKPVDASKLFGQNEEVPLLAGEKIQGEAKDVSYVCPFNGTTKGSLTVTNYKLFFRSERGAQIILDVPLGMIAKVDKVGGATVSRSANYGIEIFCKDMRHLQFAHKQENNSRREIFEKIHKWAFPISNKLNLFAYDFKEQYDENGWHVYNAYEEFKRQGLPNESWRISRINENYELSESYPHLLGVPFSVTDEDIHSVAAFRSKGRFPVLSWIHKRSQASIIRSSQPLVGIIDKQCFEDEQYIQKILEGNAQSSKVHIIDVRPAMNANTNKARGGGHETVENYQNADLSFAEIHNIHVMRESWRKLKDVCFPSIDDVHWLSNIESTHWLEHIKQIMTGAVMIADKVENQKASVLVHGSEGWDRTSQLTSLAMLMLDPFYRTIKGFEILIEKEWCSFGHKFQQQIGHGEDKNTDTGRSPVFLQFIDCVWQISKQFPNALEFNEHFLITILDHLYSCLFGTFLCNSEQERIKTGIKTSTVSLWSFVNCQMDEFRNPLYASYEHKHVILPVASIRRLQIWTSYYVRWNPRMRPQQNIHLRNRELLVLRAQLIKRYEESLKEKDCNVSNSRTPSPRMSSPVNGIVSA